ncbi:unnamed protein product [Caenorhabditis brenneri]
MFVCLGQFFQTTPTNSMSLETLQFLLQYMDANRRFEISNRCPSIRALEKRVPLEINSLTFKKGSITVNGRKYNLGIVCEYKAGKAPDYVAVENRKGGVQHDVDEYGIENESDAYTLTPGDLDIQRRVMKAPRRQDDDGTIRMLENRIREVQGWLDNRQEPIQQQRVEYRLEDILEEARARLFVYQCRQLNIPPYYRHFLQLSTSQIDDNLEQKTIQRYTHNKKYSEAVKYLTTVLLGGRSSLIYVKSLIFKCRQGIIRLPVGIKFHVKQLAFSGDVTPTMEALAPILHSSSYPLKKLDFNVESIFDLENPVVEKAEELKIKMNFDDAPFIPYIMLAFTHQRIYIKTYLYGSILEEAIRNLIQVQLPIGTERIIASYEEPLFENEMVDILKSLDGVVIDDENVIIPISEGIQINVSYEPFPEFAPRSKWGIKFLNAAVGN